MPRSIQHFWAVDPGILLSILGFCEFLSNSRESWEYRGTLSLSKARALARDTVVVIRGCGMRLKKFVAIVRVVVSRALNAMWQACTMTAYARIACAGIRAVPSMYNTMHICWTTAGKGSISAVRPLLWLRTFAPWRLHKVHG